MKKVAGVSIVVLVLALCARPLLSEEGSDNGGGEHAMPEEMSPGPEHEAMAKWAGKWTAEGKMWPGPGMDPMPMKADSEIQVIMDGRFVRETLESDMGGMKFRGEGTTGFDRVTKKYTISWIDSMGTSAVWVEGTSKDGGKTIEFKGKMSEPSIGQQVPTRWVHTEKGADEFTFEMYTGEGKEEFKVMEISYKRKK